MAVEEDSPRNEEFSLKTYKRTSVKPLIVVLSTVVALGIPLTIYAGFRDDWMMAVILGLSFFLLILIFGLSLIAEAKSILECGDTLIVFHYPLFSEDKEFRGLHRKGLAVAKRDVSKVLIGFIPGTWVSQSTKWVTFVLKDGRTFDTHFAFYGTVSEDEILKRLEAWNQDVLPTNE